ncbi:RNA-guided endonuclease InsQ/TnpB family protein [Clostridium perfringens]
MKTNRVEKHIIKKSHKMWKACDELCFKAKNLYNYANYIQRQKFINREKIYKYPELSKQIKHSEPFKDLGSNSSQMTLKILCRDWKSFLVSVKDYSKNPNKYLGKPKLPKYKKKDGRHICVLTNMQSQIKDGYLFFAFKYLKPFNNMFKVNFEGKHMQTRIIPRGSVYILEIVYEKEINELKEETNRILGIDLGVDNLATCVNNIGTKPIVINGKVLKSINQYYNKKLATLRSDLKKRHNKDWSNKLDRLQRKRDNKVDYYLHCSSKKIIKNCIENNIDTIVVGLNKTWKQESNMNKKSNQNFIAIPYDKFISQITYKAQDVGIKVITTEESYTSGCSFLDGEEIGKETYNKNRRVYRGLFVSNKGIKINADCNGAYNIIRKVVPNAFTDGIEGVDLHPIRVNI